MAEPTLTDRVEILEEKVAELDKLPTRVEAVELQILQLRDEMRGEFSAIRQAMSSESGWVRAEFAAVRQEFRQEFAAIRQEIRDGDEETRRYMRVLHEKVLSRIATLAEGRNPA